MRPFCVYGTFSFRSCRVLQGYCFPSAVALHDEQVVGVRHSRHPHWGLLPPLCPAPLPSGEPHAAEATGTRRTAHDPRIRQGGCLLEHAQGTRSSALYAILHMSLDSHDRRNRGSRPTTDTPNRRRLALPRRTSRAVSSESDGDGSPFAVSCGSAVKSPVQIAELVLQPRRGVLQEYPVQLLFRLATILDILS